MSMDYRDDFLKCERCGWVHVAVSDRSLFLGVPVAAEPKMQFSLAVAA
jgi:hypothetical protein